MAGLEPPARAHSRGRRQWSRAAPYHIIPSDASNEGEGSADGIGVVLSNHIVRPGLDDGAAARVNSVIVVGHVVAIEHEQRADSGHLDPELHIVHHHVVADRSRYHAGISVADG